MTSAHSFLLKTPPLKLFFKAAIPGAVGMIASNIYFSLEMLLVGRFLGQTAFAGGNLAMPLLLIAYAVADMIAVGSSIAIAIKLGEGRKEEADRLFTTAVITASLASTLTSLAITLSGPWLFSLMGAGDALTKEAMTYLWVYTLFIPLTSLVFVFDNYLRISGWVRFSMVMNIVMAFMCLSFEFLFLYVLKRGIGYAALGTSLGMSITCIISMLPFIKGRMPLKFVRPGKVTATLGEIIKQGFPSFLNNTSGRITSILMNTFILRLGGEVAVSIYGVFMNIDSIIVPGMYGVFDSLQPAIGYNWGAGRKDRAKRIALCCAIALCIMCLFCTFLIVSFPESIFSMFLKVDANSLSLAVHAITIMGLTYIVRWISYSGQAYASAIGRNKEATEISIYSALLFPILMMLVLFPLGLEGLWWVTPSSALLTAMAATLIFLVKLRK